jgi:hypothetical protein
VRGGAVGAVVCAAGGGVAASPVRRMSWCLGRATTSSADELHRASRRLAIAPLDLRQEGHRLVAHARELSLADVLPFRPGHICDQVDQRPTGGFATHDTVLRRAHASGTAVLMPERTFGVFVGKLCHGGIVASGDTVTVLAMYTTRTGTRTVLI